MAQYSFALTHACAALTYPLLLLHRVTAKLGCKLADPPAMMPIAELNGSKVGRGPLKTLDGLTPTVPPPPDLRDGTPVYLYAVICTADHCSEPDANVLTGLSLCLACDVMAIGPP